MSESFSVYDMLGWNRPEAPGDKVLERVHELLTTYVVLPSPEAADAVVLWIAATHAIGAWTHATRLVVRSPEKRCGKSRLLDIVAGLSSRPLMTVNATVAAIFRSLGDVPPTLLVDEADTIFGSRKVAEQNEDLRGLLNAGFQRGRPMLRCVGPNQIPTEFPTFAMVALAGIGQLPDTIEDRAVVISMNRRTATEHVAPYRARRDGPELDLVRDEVEAWVRSVEDTLRVAEPVFDLEDRAADCWEPLVAIADAAGGTWPGRARRSAQKLAGEHDAAAVEASLGVKLLADISEVFDGESMFSADLVAKLIGIPDAPWASFGLDERGLARRLAPYGVRPDRLRDSGDRRRGYHLVQLEEVFSRYLPRDPSHLSHRPNVALTCEDAGTDLFGGTDRTVPASSTVPVNVQVNDLRDGGTAGTRPPTRTAKPW
jgi:hypothetical protein